MDAYALCNGPQALTAVLLQRPKAQDPPCPGQVIDQMKRPLRWGPVKQVCLKEEKYAVKREVAYVYADTDDSLAAISNGLLEKVRRCAIPT